MSDVNWLMIAGIALIGLGFLAFRWTSYAYTVGDQIRIRNRQNAIAVSLWTVALVLILASQGVLSHG